MVDKNMVQNQIKRISLGNPKEESCGIIINENNSVKVVPLENISKEKSKHYIIKPKDFIRNHKRTLCLWHSHPDGDFGASELDINITEEFQVPTIIYSIPHDDFIYIRPSHTPSLTGRKYIYGIYDCYTLIQDAFFINHGIKLKDYKTPWGWWHGKENPFMNFEKEGFEEGEIIDGSLLLMSYNSKEINHVGYYSNDMVLHQTIFHDSKWEPLNNLERYISKVVNFNF